MSRGITARTIHQLGMIQEDPPKSRIRVFSQMGKLVVYDDLQDVTGLQNT